MNAADLERKLDELDDQRGKIEEALDEGRELFANLRSDFSDPTDDELKDFSQLIADTENAFVAALDKAENIRDDLESLREKLEEKAQAEDEAEVDPAAPTPPPEDEVPF